MRQQRILTQQIFLIVSFLTIRPCAQAQNGNRIFDSFETKKFNIEINIDRKDQKKTIEPYFAFNYDFDDTVMREILGKKLSSRQRKDLDEVSEKLNVNLKSCR